MRSLPSRLWSATLAGSLGLLGLVAGCSPAAPEPAPGQTPAGLTGAPDVHVPPDLSRAAPAPTADVWSEADTERVRMACGCCHAFPPADALPRARWEESILTMAAMPLPDGLTPLSAEDLVWAIAYYERRAPARLEVVPQATALSARARFRVDHFTPRGLERERIPAVANVAFLPLSDPPRLDLVACEMRSSTLIGVRPWDPSGAVLRPLASGLNYPVHLSRTDVDGDGRLDLLVAGIGGMNPSNETRGSVIALLAGSSGAVRGRRLARGLARTADARVADLDGDGDGDLVVTNFGWRGPGDLRWFENRGAGQEPAYVPAVIDDRDGHIHVEPRDMDGDGRLDLVTILAQEHEEVLVYLNRGGGRFEAETIFRAPHPGWGFSGLEVVDFDGDTDLDLLVSNGDTLDDAELKPYHGVTWFENRGELRFEPHAVGQLYGCERAISGDVDGDGDLDVIAVSFLPQVEPSLWKERDLDSVVWFEQESGAWIPHAIEKHACYHPTVAAADYNGDGRLDIAVGNWVWLEEDSSARTQADYLTLFTGE